jgi:hypothetical protein
MHGKHPTDIAMIIDAMDLLYSGRFDGVCLVSSDSDLLACLAEYFNRCCYCCFVERQGSL